MNMLSKSTLTRAVPTGEMRDDLRVAKPPTAQNKAPPGPEFEAQMQVARKIMAERQELLHKLAD